MKKILALIMALLLCTAVLFSCDTEEENVETECVHEFKDATCKEPKTCSKCGKTEGEVAAHTIEDGKCPTCDKSLYDVMILWDEEPGQASNSEPRYDYYNKTDYYTMKTVEAFCFWSTEPVHFGEEHKIFGSTNVEYEYTVSAQIIIDRDSIENKTYKWNLLVQKYDKPSNSYKSARMTGTLKADEFNENSTLVMDSFVDPLNIGVTEEQANTYVSEYATLLINRCVTGTLTTFLEENGQTPALLGFTNYAK